MMDWTGASCSLLLKAKFILFSVVSVQKAVVPVPGVSRLQKEFPPAHLPCLVLSSLNVPESVATGQRDILSEVSGSNYQISIGYASV